jgi:D-threo-aldose 1-dehydrogenase
MAEDATLRRRPFGQTGILAPPLCLGCAPLGDMPRTFNYRVPEERALATVRAAFGSPMNYLDTSNSYSNGESERRIGLVLRELGGVPTGAIVQTKADRDPATGDFSGPRMRRSLEESLARLGLDRLDIVFLHDPEQAPFEELMAPGGAVETLQALQREGIIGHLGVAGGPIDLLMRYVETGAFAAVLTHNRYTLLDRTADPLLSFAAARGLAVLNAAPFGGGMLAKGPESFPRYAYRDAPAALVERARQIAAICQEYAVPLPAAALQFSTRDPRITATVVGLTHPERIAQTLALYQHPIPAELWSRLAPLGG